MEKLDVGQVWQNGRRGREIVAIYLGLVKYADAEAPFPEMHATVATFKAWITRTGAKLEGRNGENS